MYARLVEDTDLGTYTRKIAFDTKSTERSYTCMFAKSHSRTESTGFSFGHSEEIYSNPFQKPPLRHGAASVCDRNRVDLFLGWFRVTAHAFIFRVN